MRGGSLGKILCATSCVMMNCNLYNTYSMFQCIVAMSSLCSYATALDRLVVIDKICTLTTICITNDIMITQWCTLKL